MFYLSRRIKGELKQSLFDSSWPFHKTVSRWLIPPLVFTRTAHMEFSFLFSSWLPHIWLHPRPRIRLKALWRIRYLLVPSLFFTPYIFNLSRHLLLSHLSSRFPSFIYFYLFLTPVPVPPAALWACSSLTFFTWHVASFIFLHILFYFFFYHGNHQFLES